MIRFSNKLVFKQPSGTNGIQEPTFDCNSFTHNHFLFYLEKSFSTFGCNSFTHYHFLFYLEKSFLFLKSALMR